MMKGSGKTAPFAYLIHDLHDFAAATGDDMAFLYMEDFVANGAIDIAFFFCPDHKSAQAAFSFVFHKFTSIKKSGRQPAPYILLLCRGHS